MAIAALYPPITFSLPAPARVSFPRFPPELHHQRPVLSLPSRRIYTQPTLFATMHVCMMHDDV